MRKSVQFEKDQKDETSFIRTGTVLAKPSEKVATYFDHEDHTMKPKSLRLERVHTTRQPRKSVVNHIVRKMTVFGEVYHSSDDEKEMSSSSFGTDSQWESKMGQSEFRPKIRDPALFPDEAKSASHGGGNGRNGALHKNQAKSAHNLIKTAKDINTARSVAVDNQPDAGFSIAGDEQPQPSEGFS